MAEVPPPDIEIENVEIPQLQDAPSEDPVATDQLEDELIADIEPAKTEERSGLRKLLSSAIGTDLTSMAVPVTYNEPLSFLQRMYEYVQYHDLLTKVRTIANTIFEMHRQTHTTFLSSSPPGPISYPPFKARPAWQHSSLLIPSIDRA